MTGVACATNVARATDVAYAINDAHRHLLACTPNDNLSHVIDVICSGSYAPECAYALANRETAPTWFIRACARGMWTLAQWLMFMYGGFGVDYTQSAFNAACAHGHESIARRLITQSWFGARNAQSVIRVSSQYGIFRVTKQAFDRYGLYLSEHNTLTEYKQHAFVNACEYGCVWFIRWLDKTYGLDVDDVRNHRMDAFTTACAHGHWPLARWMVIRFELTRKHIRDAGCQSLIRPCAHGQIHIVRWLVEHFRLTARDIRNTKTMAFIEACANGHLELVQWLTDRFRLTTRDARSGHNHALIITGCGGHIAMMQWLVARFGLGRDGARVDYGYPLMRTTESVIAATKWVLMAFGLARRKKYRWYPAIISYAADEDTVEMAWWIVRRFGITPCDIEPSLNRYNNWLSVTARGDGPAQRWFDAFAAEC